MSNGKLALKQINVNRLYISDCISDSIEHDYQ